MYVEKLRVSRIACSDDYNCKTRMNSWISFEAKGEANKSKDLGNHSMSNKWCKRCAMGIRVNTINCNHNPKSTLVPSCFLY